MENQICEFLTGYATLATRARDTASYAERMIFPFSRVTLDSTDVSELWDILYPPPGNIEKIEDCSYGEVRTVLTARL